MSSITCLSRECAPVALAAVLALAGAVAVSASALEAPAALGAGETPHAVYTPPPCTGTLFADINCSTPFDAWIEQFVRDGITAGCGGGNYCPDGTVTRAQMAVFIEKAMRGTANWPPFTLDVQAVLAVDGTPDPIASGAALLVAVESIPTTGTRAPSGDAPWRIRVGPGLYDLGSAQLNLPPWVMLEGAGSLPFGLSLTTIRSAGTVALTGTVVLTGWNSLRDVRIANTGTAQHAVAVYAVDATVSIERTRLLAYGGSNANYGLHASGTSNITLDHADVYVEASGSANAGLFLNGSTVAQVLDSEITLASASAGGTCILKPSSGTLKVARSTLRGNSNVNTATRGVVSSQGQVEILESSIYAGCRGAAPEAAVAVSLTSGSTSVIKGSTLKAIREDAGCATTVVDATTTGLDISGSVLSAATPWPGTAFGFTATGNSLSRVWNTTIEATAFNTVFVYTGATVRISNSQLLGSPASAAGGTLTCGGVTDENGVFSASTCP